MIHHRDFVRLATVSTTAVVTAFTLSRCNSDDSNSASSNNKSSSNSSNGNQTQVQTQMQTQTQTAAQSSLFVGKSSNLDKMKDNITKFDNTINRNYYPLYSHLLYDQNSITHCKEQAPLSSAIHTTTTKSTLMMPESSYKPLTKAQSILYKLRLLNDKSLTTPRLLSPNDPIFEYRALKNGLKLRTKDELRLRELQIEISALVQKQQQQEQEQQNTNDGTNGSTNNSNNEEKRIIMKDMMERISEVVNGKGITPQMREDFLIVSCIYFFILCGTFVDSSVPTITTIYDVQVFISVNAVYDIISHYFFLLLLFSFSLPIFLISEIWLYSIYHTYT